MFQVSLTALSRFLFRNIFVNNESLQFVVVSAILWTMAQGTNLPADGLQIPFVELLLGDCVLLGFLRSLLLSKLTAMGERGIDCRLEVLYPVEDTVIKREIFRLEPPLEQVESLHDARQSK